MTVVGGFLIPRYRSTDVVAQSQSAPRARDKAKSDGGQREQYGVCNGQGSTDGMRYSTITALSIDWGL